MARLKPFVPFLLGVAVGVGGCLLFLRGGVDERPDAPQAVSPHPDGIHLTVVVSKHDVAIVRHEPHDDPLEPAKLPQPPAGRVLHATLFDGVGKRLATYGWPADGLEVYHGKPSEEVALRTHLAHKKETVRVIDVPVVDRAVYLTLAVSGPRDITGEVHDACNLPCISCGYGDGPQRQLESLALYPLLVDRHLSAKPKTLDPPAPGLPDIIIRPACIRKPLVTGMTYEGECSPERGKLLGTKLLHGSDETAGRYDVVILGDGFVESQAALFGKWAQRYADAFLGTEPFQRLQDKINIHTVAAASPEDGVSACPGGQKRDTYFGVAGQWVAPGEDDRGAAGFFGTDDHCRVYRAAAEVGPIKEIELVVMIAHCDVYGGKAEPWAKMVYLPTHTAEGKFEQLAMHETGHTAAFLGEEYVSCADPHPHYTYPGFFANVVPAEHAEDAWWKALLTDEERTAEGEFLAVTTCAEGFRSDRRGTEAECKTGAPATIPRFPHDGASPSMLGLYWGALYGNAVDEVRNQCHVYCGENEDDQLTGAASCDFFRSMNTCHMRDIAQPFCRACEELLCQAVKRVDPAGIECALDELPFMPGFAWQP